ncbi:MAG: hypothetical protein R3C44_10490 [Chloroflexota bacterium]
MTQPSAKRHFDRAAGLYLLLTGALLVFAVANTVYRFSLPTDGWLSTEPEGIDTFGYIYDANIMGAPSDLQAGDHLVAVEGISLSGASPTTLWAVTDKWQEGSTMRYTIERDDQTLHVDVPLVKWDLISYWRGIGRSIANVFNYVGTVLFAAVALLAFWRSPDNPAARALWVIAAAAFTAVITLDFLPQMVVDGANPITSLTQVFIIGLLFTVLFPPSLIRFALVFPKRSPLLQKWPWLAWAPYLVGLLVLIAFAFGQFGVGFAWISASFVIAFVIIIYNAIIYRDAVSRAQLRWGVGGVALGLALLLLDNIPTFIPSISEPVQVLVYSLSAFGLGIMGIGLGIAVMRYRLFDIDVIIRRTTSYAILTGMLLLVYFGSVIILQRLLAPITGESTVAVVLSTLLIAALFLPLRRRVQEVIDRRFFRQKYDAEQVLEQFAATVRDETDLDALTAELVRVIRETMQPEFVSVWLKEPEK